MHFKGDLVSRQEVTCAESKRACSLKGGTLPNDKKPISKQSVKSFHHQAIGQEVIKESSISESHKGLHTRGGTTKEAGHLWQRDSLFTFVISCIFWV